MIFDWLSASFGRAVKLRDWFYGSVYVESMLRLKQWTALW